MKVLLESFMRENRKLRIHLHLDTMFRRIMSRNSGPTASLGDDLQDADDELQDGAESDESSDDAGATTISHMKAIVGNGRYESVLAAGTSDGTKKRQDAALIHIKNYLKKVEYRS
jgi:hypothetical protein